MNKSEFTAKKKVFLQDMNLLASMIEAKRKVCLELVGYGPKADNEHDDTSDCVYALEDLFEAMNQMEIQINRIKVFDNGSMDS